MSSRTKFNLQSTMVILPLLTVVKVEVECLQMAEPSIQSQ